MPRLQFATAFIILAIFSVTAYTSCIKDKCSDVACYNKGVCVQGICTCPYLYEGQNCQEYWLEKFSGSWNSDETFAKDTSRTHHYYDLKIEGAYDSFFVFGLADTLGIVQCKRDTRYKFTFRGDQRVDSFVTIKSGRGSIANDGSAISGVYTYNFKQDKKDTTITMNFIWRH